MNDGEVGDVLKAVLSTEINSGIQKHRSTYSLAPFYHPFLSLPMVHLF